MAGLSLASHSHYETCVFADPSQVVESYVAGDSSEIIFTAEHASQAFPASMSMPETDRWLKDTHWAYDIGAATLTREAADAFQTSAVLAGFSRLLCDPNRPLDSPELIRKHADHKTIQFNMDLTPADIDARKSLWTAYHDRVDQVLAVARGTLLVAMHTFTPLYQGQRRAVEIGVLFDREEDLAKRLAECLSKTGCVVRMNEPYSGKEGLLYSADRHATKHGRRALEIELRQDLAVRPKTRAAVIEALNEWSQSI